MAYVQVLKATMTQERITTMTVALHGLADRELDRATVIAWMKDGHSFLPISDGRVGPALRMLEVDGEAFIRSDSEASAADVLPKALIR